AGATHSRDCTICPQGTYGQHNRCSPTTVPWTPLPTATRVPRGTCLQADRPRASPRLALVDRRGKVIWTGVRCVPQIACPPGEYATESSAECSTCPPGTYSVRTSISIPIVHYYANQDGDSICKPTACAPGSGAPVGATHPTSNCQVCGRGEFSLGDDQPCAPTACPVGTASSVEGSDLEKGNCLPCAEGYFSAGGADQCKQARCPAGGHVHSHRHIMHHMNVHL
ncbi:hypothetical protein DYB35_007284, partial [Aphanomyces astaci]